MEQRISYGYEALDAFQKYWDELSAACRIDRAGDAVAGGAHLVPKRRDFNPMKLHTHLPDIYITELLSDEQLLVRLSGTRIDDNAGYVLKGTNFLDICHPTERALHVTSFKAMISHPCGVEMTRRIMLSDGRVHQFKSISLPLADREGVPRFIVGITNVAPNIVYETKVNRSDKLRSQVMEFNFVDVGAGVPPKPE